MAFKSVTFYHSAQSNPVDVFKLKNYFRRNSIKYNDGNYADSYNPAGVQLTLVNLMTAYKDQFATDNITITFPFTKVLLHVVDYSDKSRFFTDIDAALQYMDSVK